MREKAAGEIDGQKEETADYLSGQTAIGSFILEDCNSLSFANGYGACSVSGCFCQGYMGQADTCSNCGHSYASHW